MIRSFLKLYLLVGSLILSACEYNYVDISGILPDQVSYNEHVQPIFNDNCMACHNSIATPPVLLQNSAYKALMEGGYIDIDEPDQSKLIIKINSGHPTVDTPTDFEKQLLLLWIVEGALNN